jgi:hypothetical protein
MVSFLYRKMDLPFREVCGSPLNRPRHAPRVLRRHKVEFPQCNLSVRARPGGSTTGGYFGCHTRFGGEQWRYFASGLNRAATSILLSLLRTTAGGLRLRTSPMKWRHKPSSPLVSGGPW